MQQVRVRSARAADAAALQAIEDSSFSSDRISPRQMRYLLQRAKALNLLIETDAGIKGYCICLTPAHPRPARLYSLAIAREARGSGLGSALLERLLKRLPERGYTRLRLEVRAGDIPTQRLYRQTGFCDITRIADYYEDGEAALRMELQLAGPSS